MLEEWRMSRDAQGRMQVGALGGGGVTAKPQSNGTGNGHGLWGARLVAGKAQSKNTKLTV